MRALLIDDEHLVLEGLEALLQAVLPDLSLDKTASVETAFELAGQVHYEVLLLDWRLVSAGGQPLDGARVVEGLRASGSTAPIVVISGVIDTDLTRAVLDLGLAGYVPKSAPSAALIDAIRVATRGGVYLPAAGSRPFGRTLPSPSTATRTAPPGSHVPPPSGLTARQIDVFHWMARGMSDKQIGRELGISETTVKSHVRAILDAAGVRRRGEAVFQMQAALRHSLTT